LGLLALSKDMTDKKVNETKTLYCTLNQSPTVAEDIKTNAYSRSWQLCFVYLMISYRKWQYSLGAIAVAHDVIFVLGIYSLCYKFMP
jgi:preprotein translocase subunit SecF